MCDPTAVSFLMMWRNGGAKIAPLLGLEKIKIRVGSDADLMCYIFVCLCFMNGPRI
jgi:hypothetical protein